MKKALLCLSILLSLLYSCKKDLNNQNIELPVTISEKQSKQIVVAKALSKAVDAEPSLRKL